MTPDVSDLTALTACDLVDAYASRALSPVEVVEATLARIDHLDGPINAFVTLTPERALADARRAEAAHAAGDAPPLAGVPYTLKDLLDAEGIPTGHGSPLFRDPAPSADAPVAARLRAGALLGKTTTPERGWKGDSGNTLNGACHNPWRHGRTAGGSLPPAAQVTTSGFVRLAVLPDAPISQQASRDPRAAVTIAQPAAQLLSQKWTFSHPQMASAEIIGARLVPGQN